MRITLTFDLPEEKDEFMTAIHAGRYVSTLLEIDTELRARLKYCANENAGELVAFLSELRSTLHEALTSTNWRD